MNKTELVKMIEKKLVFLRQLVRKLLTQPSTLSRVLSRRVIQFSWLVSVPSVFRSVQLAQVRTLLQVQLSRFLQRRLLSGRLVLHCFNLLKEANIDHGFVPWFFISCGIVEKAVDNFGITHE